MSQFQRTWRKWISVLGLSFGWAVACPGSHPVAQGAERDPPASAEPVSYHRQIKPIFQAHCQGCHQPAKASGDYVMTEFSRLLKGGESNEAAIVAGKPDASHLLAEITPQDGKAKMPQGKPPLSATDRELIRRWIAEGARDDSPASARQQYDADHPPQYTRLPVVPSVDYSPDGTLLAVAGYHEVLLHKADGTGLAGRLVGIAERIQSVKFSPDGKLLAAAGGLPSRVGELQIWDVAARKLKLSISTTFDTIYGASWSPDGKLLAIGAGDNSVRAFLVETGEQVLFMGSHNDWVNDTVFSADGSHLVSVGRDSTVKLTEVETQRFNDNITSITPGALRGGIHAVARHPNRDEIVTGGSDGVPKIYRIHRITKRVIGDDANLIANLGPLLGRVFDVDVSRDGKRIVAVSSLDGQGELGIYAYDADTTLPDDLKAIHEKTVNQRTPEETAKLEKFYHQGFKQQAKLALPTSLYAVAFTPDGGQLASAGGDGVIRIHNTADGKVVREFPAAPLASSEALAVTDVDFIRDVNPILTKLGCNQGTCHGAKDGKNGFKLSLRGYDPLFDIRAFTDDFAARRMNVASPDQSLILLKATGAVPHVGGQLVKPDDEYYRTLRSWIAGGAKLNLSIPRVTKIEVEPRDPVVQKAGQRVQMKVIASYADGKRRDVTREAFVESGNTEVALHNSSGELTALRRGEAPILARYEGAYAASILTVMGEREGFAWEDPPRFNKIDDLTAAKWKRLKIRPSELCTDEEFIRRVSLDLTGLPPTVEAIKTFLADTRETRVKRDALVDQLVGSEAYIDHWTNKWADLLQVNTKFLGNEGAVAFRGWIRKQLADNLPYDDFARQVLTASGSNRENPAASYYKILRDPANTMENTTHLFLAIRFNCNKCHDHPFERWTQDQYYQTAAYFAQFDLKADPAAGSTLIGQTAVERGKPLYEIVYDKPAGDVKHDRTGQVTPPEFPFDCKFEAGEKATRREQLAAWITSSDNPYFARSYVNRLWGYLFGVGIMEPIDDIRAGNPPTNPELLTYLTEEFIRQKFDVRALIKQICKSRTYQLSVVSNEWNEDDRINYSHAIPRRLQAEVLFDAVHAATGSVSNLPGFKPGTRAAELPDATSQLANGFLQTFGRPARESACECERTGGVALGPVMALISGPTLSNAIADANNALAKLVKDVPDDNQLIDELFLRVLNRRAKPAEIKTALEVLQEVDVDHQRLAEKLAEREKWWVPELARLERERAAALKQAQDDLAAYEKDLKPRREQQEKDRLARLAAAEKSVEEFVSKLGEHVAAWEKKQTSIAPWSILQPTKLSVKDGQLKRKTDGSIVASGKNEKGAYVFQTRTEQGKITGLRLEVLPDERFPAQGPGLAKDGNFVLTEFEVAYQPAKAGSPSAKVELQKPAADFNQAGFNLAQVIDGQPNQGGGWGIGGRTGQTHWLTLELKQPLTLEPGGTLTITLHQQFTQPSYMIGRFRLSATSAATPIGVSLPEDVAQILAIPAEERDVSEVTLLGAFFKRQDAEYLKRTGEVAAAKAPLPPDPTLLAKQATVKQLSEVTPTEPILAQLREDVKMSQQQVANKRLTVVQDLTWALINSPAFLFNH